MSRFFKFLIMVAAIANLVLIFAFEGAIPEYLPLPFFMQKAESEENGAGEPAIEEAAFEEAGPAVQTEKMTEPEAGTEAEPLPEETAAAEETPEEEEPVPVCRIISPEGSNIRSGPGVDFEVIASYPYDTVLVLTGEYEIGWHSILAEDGTEGYIFETQIELPEGYTTEETVY